MLNADAGVGKPPLIVTLPTAKPGVGRGRLLSMAPPYPIPDRAETLCATPVPP